MKCPYCKGTGKSNMWINGANVPCNVCKGTGEAEVTNEQWLRQASTEELAEWIVEMSTICTINHQCELCDSWCDEKKVMEWLKQPHTDKER